MSSIARIKKFILLSGDILVFYAALMLMLAVRYGRIAQGDIENHVPPFSLLLGIWIVAFYVGGLYDFKFLRHGADFVKRSAVLLIINAAFAVGLFYFVPALAITPRLNLFLFLFIFSALGYLWRDFFNRLLSGGLPRKKILLIGSNETTNEVAEYLERNPQLGYRIVHWMREGTRDPDLPRLPDVIRAHRVNMIVVPAHVRQNARATRLIYRHLAAGLEVLDLASLYELIFQKIPLAELEEGWFLENIAKEHLVYESFKRPAEALTSGCLGLALFPLMIVIALAIKFASRGPIFFSQRRIGQSGKIFSIHKFRTMREDAERMGPQWARADDPRNTAVGRILRRTHLDELPQLWNVFKGDLSFVGPRPERPEFVDILAKEIPFYELRHLVRPGVSGWAQINFRYGASIKEAYEKLQYDMYYLKNRSAILDAFVILRTIRFLFLNIS